jgi:hypothetical protein
VAISNLSKACIVCDSKWFLGALSRYFTTEAFPWPLRPSIRHGTPDFSDAIGRSGSLRTDDEKVLEVGMALTLKDNQNVQAHYESFLLVLGHYQRVRPISDSWSYFSQLYCTTSSGSKLSR